MGPAPNEVSSLVSKFNTQRINSTIGTPVAFLHNNWMEGGVYKAIDVNGVNSVIWVKNVNNTKQYKV